MSGAHRQEPPGQELEGVASARVAAKAAAGVVARAVVAVSQHQGSREAERVPPGGTTWSLP